MFTEGGAGMTAGEELGGARDVVEVTRRLARAVGRVGCAAAELKRADMVVVLKMLLTEAPGLTVTLERWLISPVELREGGVILSGPLSSPSTSTRSSPSLSLFI